MKLQIFFFLNRLKQTQWRGCAIPKMPFWWTSSSRDQRWKFSKETLLWLKSSTKHDTISPFTGNYRFACLCKCTECIHICISEFIWFVLVGNLGTVSGKWGPLGQTGQNSLRSARFGPVEATLTGSLFGDRKAHCGGTLIAHGLGLRFTELSSFAPGPVLPTPSLRPSAKHPSFSVTNAFSIYTFCSFLSSTFIGDD